MWYLAKWFLHLYNCLTIWYRQHSLIDAYQGSWSQQALNICKSKWRIHTSRPIMTVLCIDHVCQPLTFPKPPQNHATLWKGSWLTSNTNKSCHFSTAFCTNAHCRFKRPPRTRLVPTQFLAHTNWNYHYPDAHMRSNRIMITRSKTKIHFKHCIHLFAWISSDEPFPKYI